MFAFTTAPQSTQLTHQTPCNMRMQVELYSVICIHTSEIAATMCVVAASIDILMTDITTTPPLLLLSKVQLPHDKGNSIQELCIFI
jgi:hypothetical protein